MFSKSSPLCPFFLNIPVPIFPNHVFPKYKSRTLLEEGLPVIQILVDRDENVKGITTYEVDLEKGDILWADAHKLTDQDGDSTNGTQLVRFDRGKVSDNGTMTNLTQLETAGIYEQDLYESRTFIEDDNPVMRLTVNKDEEVSAVEIFKISGDGRVLWVDAFKMADQDTDDTNGVQLVGFDADGGSMEKKEDITDRIKADKEKKSLESQLRQFQKIETIGRLAGGIAHDFNNIITPIIIFAELMQDDLDESDPHHKYLDHILDGVNRAKALAQQILTFSRHEEEERKPLQLLPTIKEAIEMIRPMLPTTIEIRQSLGDCKTVLANSTQIHQVVMNICTNAYHVMQDTGGILELKLQTAEVDEEFAKFHINLEPGRYAQLSISDTGCGMCKETTEKIFDPFFTTKEIGKGTGLGLSVVHGIVTSHKGGIVVYSEPGLGTTFHIYLPLIENEIEEKSEEKEVAVRKGKECILLVDDEKEILFTGKKMLERNGYQVETKANSLEALEEFRNNPHKFDLVITDYTMPKMTGRQLAEELMKVRPNLPVILMGGSNPGLAPEDIKGFGIREYIMKPFSVKSFNRIVRRVLEEE